MELIIKSAAAGLTVSVLALLIKKSNPEFSLLLGVTVTAVITAAALGFMDCIKELAQTVQRMTRDCEPLLSPVLKCLGVAVISKMSAELCRDSSQSAAAAAVEFAGCVCTVSIAMPLILSVLNMISGFI